MKPDALTTKHPEKPRLKPALPSKGDVPLFGLVDTKDYITSNAIDNILAEPRKCSLEQKNYLQKKDYGKIPKYIERIRQEVERENAFQRKLREQEEALMKSKRRLLTPQERSDILSGLKTKWDEVNSEYQKMTHMTVLDTLSKVHRKESLESSLGQLEKDMELLNRNEDIMIDLEA